MDRRVLIPLAALVLAIGGCGGDDEGAGDADEPDWSGKSVRIGSIFSTTGIGEAVGPQQVNGAELAAEEINADGGIHGAEIEIEQVDDGSDPKHSAKAMRELITKQEVVAVLGPTFTNAAVMADPIAERMKVPVVGVSNTGQDYGGDCGRCDFVWRVSLPEIYAISENVQRYNDATDTKRVAVVHPLDDPFAEATARTAVKSLRQDGFEVTGTEVFAPEEAGPQPAIEAAMDDEAEAIFVTTSSGTGAADVIKVAREVGFEGDLLGGNAFNISTASEEAGSAGKGAQSTAAWYAGNESEANQDFIEAYTDRYGNEPDQFAAQAYMGLKVVAQAIEKGEVDPDDLRQVRFRIRNAFLDVRFDDSPLGPFNLDAVHDPVQTMWTVQMDGEGGYDLVSENSPVPGE